MTVATNLFFAVTREGRCLTLHSYISENVDRQGNVVESARSVCSDGVPVSYARIGDAKNFCPQLRERPDLPSGDVLQCLEKIRNDWDASQDTLPTHTLPPASFLQLLAGRVAHPMTKEGYAAALKQALAQTAHAIIRFKTEEQPANTGLNMTLATWNLSSLRVWEATSSSVKIRTIAALLKTGLSASKKPIGGRRIASLPPQSSQERCAYPRALLGEGVRELPSLCRRLSKWNVSAKFWLDMPSPSRFHISLTGAKCSVCMHTPISCRRLRVPCKCIFPAATSNLNFSLQWISTSCRKKRLRFGR